MNFGFQLRLGGGEVVGKFREQLGINGDARPLHVGQHHDQRSLKRFVNADLVLGQKAGLQQHGKTQGDVGILGGVFHRFDDFDTIESDLVLALARDLGEGNRLVAEVQLAEFVHAMAVQPA